jgi:hypothetical protein
VGWPHNPIVDTSFDPTRPPDGAWFQQTERGFEVGATTRSWLQVSLMLPFVGLLLFIFVEDLLHQKPELMTFVLKIPALLLSLFLIGRMVMVLCGKVQVRVEGDEGQVFVGAGPLGKRQRFSWRALCDGTITERHARRSNSQLISLKGAEQVVFGTLLGDERRQFVVAALKEMQRARHAT